MSDDKPPSSRGAERGLWNRLLATLKGEPKSRDEILGLLTEAGENSVFDADELGMINGVLEVAETQVRDVMIPRSQMVVLETDQSFREMLKTIIDSGHSRFPVHGGDRDEIIGVLLAKDLLRCVELDQDEPIDIERWVRPAVFIPEAKRLNTLLKEFRASHNHMAIVVDEYGGVSGLLTIEDVLEEIVGEIDDEHDTEEAEFIRADGERDGRPAYAVRALTRIEDFNNYFDCKLSDENYDTVGGLVMGELGRMPRRGEIVDHGGFRFHVVRADRRRIDLLSVQPLPATETPAA